VLSLGGQDNVLSLQRIANGKIINLGGILGFFTREEKMVAGPDHHHALIIGPFDILLSRQRCGAVYLYLVLKGKGGCP